MTLSEEREKPPKPALLIPKEISSHFCPDDLLPVSERVEIGEALMDLGLSSMGGRFIGCRTEDSEILFTCQDCGHLEVRKSSCNVRFCPRCNGRRYRLLEEKFGSGLSRMKAPIFVSLSYPNVSVLDRAELDYLTKAFSKLRRSKCFRRVRGGFYDTSTTFNPSSLTYNLHLHAVIDAPFLNRGALYARWLKITAVKGGRTRNVYLERAYVYVHGKKVRWHPRRKKHVKHAILKACSSYLIGHAVKAPSLPSSGMMAQFLFACYHKRLLQGFGNMFNLPPALRRRMKCVECGGSSFTFEGYVNALYEHAKAMLDRPGLCRRRWVWAAG